MQLLKTPQSRQLTFWIFFWLVQSLLFSIKGGIDFYMAKNVAIVSLQAAVVYINLYGLTKLLAKGKYLLYTAFSLLLIYLVFAISFEVIGIAFAIFFLGIKRMVVTSDASWWPTDFWYILSGSVPYSLALLGSTIYHLVRISNKQLPEQTTTTEQEDSEEHHTLMLKEGKVIHKLDVRDILYVQGMKEYVSWHTSDKKLVTLHSLAKLESILGEKGFLRTHKSFIVNTRCVEMIKYDSVEIPGKKIPIGRSYRTKVQACFASEL